MAWCLAEKQSRDRNLPKNLHSIGIHRIKCVERSCNESGYKSNVACLLSAMRRN